MPLTVAMVGAWADMPDLVSVIRQATVDAVVVALVAGIRAASAPTMATAIRQATPDSADNKQQPGQPGFFAPDDLHLVPSLCTGNSGGVTPEIKMTIPFHGVRYQTNRG